ncbi:MAG TPA: hypothetical protein VFG78_03150 [Gemmatimonadota bacterium]|nr:hypothetical protein [Gemmatimonadota bacterium]
MRKHPRTLLFAIAVLLPLVIPLAGYAQTCLGLPAEGGDRLAALDFQPGQVNFGAAVNPLGLAGFAAGVARQELPLGGQTERRSVRFAFEEIESGRFTLCPLVAIEHHRTPVGAEALRMPLGMGVGATLGSLRDAGWGPHAALGFLPTAPIPPRMGEPFRERPLYHASLIDRLGIMTWKGPLFATASLRALSAARPDLRLGIRF